MVTDIFNTFLIKYAEIGTKGKNRYIFEDTLVKQIKNAMYRTGYKYEVIKESGRIYVNLPENFDYDEVVDALKKVFGIVGICPVMQVEDEGFDKLKETVIKYFGDVYEDKNLTFKVKTRRTRKNYPLESNDVNMELGGALLDAYPELKVDVHNPQVWLHVEIRNQINIYSEPHIPQIK